MKRRLALVGIDAISNVVDITNYILKELGQPMHAFDYTTLEGNAINVRRATNGEKIVKCGTAYRSVSGHSRFIHIRTVHTHYVLVRFGILYRILIGGRYVHILFISQSLIYRTGKYVSVGFEIIYYLRSVGLKLLKGTAEKHEQA